MRLSVNKWLRNTVLRGGALAMLLACFHIAPAAAEDFPGIVYPSRDLALSLGVGGLVAAVKVEVGGKVESGQVLLALDERMANIEVERRRVISEDRSELQALEERQVILSELYDSAVKLFGLTGGISQEEVQKAKLDLSDTRGRIEQIKARKLREDLEYRAAMQERQALRLLAPAAGIVTRVELDVGEWAKPGELAVQMVDTSKCYLRVSVSSAAARNLAPGMKLPLQIDGAANAAIVGRLTYVAPVADAASGLVELRVLFDNPRGLVRPGASARVRIAGH
jgi:RND family efflux transporter MFP subunit